MTLPVGPQGLDRLSMSLFDAAVVLNPHQIEAALFRPASPTVKKGVILADEVGLGKTSRLGSCSANAGQSESAACW